MLRIINFELYKIACKPRSYIGFIAVGIIAGLIHFAMYMDGTAYISMFTQSLEQAFSIEGKILNGNLVCFIILQMLIIHVPLLVALVTGDLMSGEAASGSLRLLVTKPVSRTQLLFSKFIAGAIYTLSLLVFLALIALGLGLIVFGHGDLMVLRSEGLTIIQDGDIIWRFFAAFAVAYIALLSVAALSFMLSCFSNNSIGPIISTMAVIILFTIIATLEVSFFDTLKPYLFTTHMVSWRLFFDAPVEYNRIINSLLILGAHIFIFITIAWWHFTKKDIMI